MRVRWWYRAFVLHAPSGFRETLTYMAAMVGLAAGLGLLGTFVLFLFLGQEWGWRFW